MTLLRFVLWMLPTIVLPFAILLGGSLYPLWPIGVIAGLAAFYGIGYFDQRIRLQQEQKDPSTEKHELVRWAIIFMLLQLMIAPAIGFTVIYGFCMITGSGYF